MCGDYGGDLLFFCWLWSVGGGDVLYESGDGNWYLFGFVWDMFCWFWVFVGDEFLVND